MAEVEARAGALGGEDWHRADIKAALEKTPEGWSSRRLSEAHGYHHTAVSEALKRPWPAVERIIANALGLEPWEIWPSRYRFNPHSRAGSGARGAGTPEPIRGKPLSVSPPREGPFARPRRGRAHLRKMRTGA